MTTIIESKYLKFIHFSNSPSGKTKIIHIFSSMNDKYRIGVIQWYSPWRKYCFYPDYLTIWDMNCLQDVNKCIQHLMNERKNNG